MLLVLGAPPRAAFAAEPGSMVLAVDSVAQVFNNVRAWLMGLLFAWASLCLTIGFLRWTSGEPDEVEKGKRTLRNAAIGFAGALLTPLLLTIISKWVA
ncbi:pilin [Paractinoplanes globisporus]|uniref:Pilin n=1 Tax=Paractinoplanes globisporus TaxID=113565 RepID=A0ABW6WJD4_9ACTN|nr:pilin [Actinoplanes globisporus]